MLAKVADGAGMGENGGRLEIFEARLIWSLTLAGLGL